MSKTQGAMNNMMKKAVQQRMAEKFGGDGSLEKAGQNVVNAPQIIREGLSNSVSSVTDPDTYTDKINVSLEPVRLTRNLFNTNDRTFGERGYDLYRNRLENKFSSKPSVFANMADNRDLALKDKQTTDMISESIRNQFDENKDYFRTPIKSIDALGLSDAQKNLAREEIKKSNRKFKLKKRGIFG